MKTLLRTRLMIILAMMVIGLMETAYAQNITVVTEDWPPYSYLENNEVAGLTTEIVRATLQQAGITADFELNAWARSYDMATKQANVLIYNIRRTPQREELFKWVAPTIPSLKQMLFKLKKRADIVINSWEDAKQYTIGVMKEDSAHQILLAQGFEEEKNIFPVPKEVQNIRKLFSGKVDLMTGFDLSLALQIKNEGFAAADIEPVFTLFEGEAYMAFSKQTPDELVKRVQTAFEEINANGTIEAIWKKYSSQ